VVASGAQIISDIDKAGFTAAMKPVYDRFVTDPALKGMVTRVQNTAK
jgi:hypothetical protein